MKNGYDQFFVKAQKARAPQKPVRRQSSQVMAEQLRERVQLRKPKKSRPVPWKMIISSSLGFLVAGFGLYHYEKVESLFKRVEITVLGEAFAEDTKKPEAAKVGEPTKGATPPAAAETATKAEPAVAEKKDFTPEEVNHFAKLNERKRELDAREVELQKTESELAAQKAELEKRIQELEQTRKNISQVLEERVQADDKKVETLVQMYSNMKPQQAAKVFETMDEDLAVEIIGRMKKKNAAEIMNLIKADKAQTFSEKFAGYKRK